MGKIITLVFFMLIGFSHGMFSQANILLQYQPPPGLSFISNYDITTIINQEIMGIDQQIEMKMLMQMENVVDSTNESGSFISTSYKRLAIETTTPSGRVRVDSESPDEQIGKQYLESMTNKKFIVHFDKKGRVQEIRGLERIIDDITSGITDENPVIQIYKSTLNDAFGALNIKNSLNQITPFFPSFPVGTGDSWTWELASGTAQFEFYLNNRSTIKDISTEKVIIQTVSVISTPGKESINIDGMDALMKLSGNQVSELFIRPGIGLASEGVIKQVITGEIELNLPENVHEKMIIPMTITTRINLSVNFR